MQTHIYGLLDPGTLESRYVGQSINVDRRYKEHVYGSRRGNPGRVCNWVRSILSTGKKPVLSILETCSEIDADSLEKVWIERRRREGCRLTNCTDGGSGITELTRILLSQTQSDKKPSLETRAKMSLAQTKRHEKYPVTPEQCQAISERMKGNKHPLGVKRSAETKAKMSLAHSGSNSPTAAFTDEIAIEIRTLFASGIPQTTLAERYSASTVDIHRLVRRKTYKHIP